MVYGRYDRDQHKIIFCCLSSHLSQEENKPNTNKILIFMSMQEWINGSKPKQSQEESNSLSSC